LYYQFWKIVGRETMRREVSNSSLIDQILKTYADENGLALEYTNTPLLDDPLEPERIEEEENLAAKLAGISWPLDDTTNPIDTHLHSHSHSRVNRGCCPWVPRWEPVATLKEHTGSIKTIAVHPSEGFFLTGSKDGAKCWSLSSFRSLVTYGEHTHSVGTVHFLHSSLAASCDSTIHIWDWERRVSLVRFAEDDTHFLAFNPVYEGRVLLAATAEASITVLDVTAGRRVAEWMVPFHTGHIRALALGPAEGDASFQHMSLPSGALSQYKWLAAGSTTGAISLVDSRTGVLLDTWKAHEGQVLKLLPFGGHFLLSSSTDRTIIQWDLRHTPPQIRHVYKGHVDPVLAMALVDTNLFAASSNKVGHVSLMTNEHVGNVVKCEPQRLQQNKANITALEVLKYHQLLLVGTEDGLTKICC
jgi:WD repeat-containing protein 81